MSKRIFTFDQPAVGMDGEGFFVDCTGEPVSVEGKLGGVKNSPVLIDSGNGGYLEDGVAWEINPDPVPKSSDRFTYNKREAQQFADNILACIAAVEARAAALDLSVSITPAKLFNPEDLVSAQSIISGCSPSANAWSRRRNPAVDLSATNWRFASGDIHLSWPDPDNRDKYSKYSRINVARYADLFFGLAEVLSTNRTERNNYYGQAGNNRPTCYGVEYKSMGNWWMTSVHYMKWVYVTGLKAIENGLSHDQADCPALEEYSTILPEVKRVWDRGRALSILGDWGIPIPPAYS